MESERLVELKLIKLVTGDLLIGGVEFDEETMYYRLYDYLQVKVDITENGEYYTLLIPYLPSDDSPIDIYVENVLIETFPSKVLTNYYFEYIIQDNESDDTEQDDSNDSGTIH